VLITSISFNLLNKMAFLPQDEPNYIRSCET